MSYDREENFEAEPKMNSKLWKRLFGYALRNRGLLVKIIVAMLLVSIIDALYPVLTRFAIDHFVRPEAEPTTNGLWLFFAIYAALVLLQGFFTTRFIGWSGKMENAISYAIRQEAYLKLQTLSFSFYDRPYCIISDTISRSVPSKAANRSSVGRSDWADLANDSDTRSY